MGILGHFGPSRLFKISINDRQAARACVEQILSWDFDRIFLAHGQIIHSGGKDEFRRAFDWLL